MSIQHGYICKYIFHRCWLIVLYLERPNRPPRYRGANATSEECAASHVGHLPTSDVKEDKERGHQTARTRQRHAVAAKRIVQRRLAASLFHHFVVLERCLDRRSTKPGRQAADDDSRLDLARRQRCEREFVRREQRVCKRVRAKLHRSIHQTPSQWTFVRGCFVQLVY
jgi:hypothetical protein